MKKNDTFTAVCSGYTFDGAGVVHAGDMVFFVPGLIAGEEAELGITAMKKNYGYARIVRLLKKSAHRREPACSVYRQCGGCQLMHMDITEQHAFKEDKVRNCFRQNAGMEVDILPILYTPEQTAYRNKVQVPVQYSRGQVLMGFYRNRTNDIVEYDRCLVQTDFSNDVTGDLRRWLKELRCADEFRHVLIRHAHNSGQAMICMIVRHYPFRGADELLRRIQKKYPQVRSISCIINRREDNVILDGKEVILSGPGYIEEELLGRIFRISARSFFQINPYSTAVLYGKAVETAGLTGKETVIDLYCGTGTIGILAAAQAKQVYGIEIVADAIKDARINAERNGVRNIEFMTADANTGARQLLRNQVKADVVIVDPPRKGCTQDTLDAIVRIAPQKLVYVSCDPATLARDCAYMREKGYEVQSVQPVDMFPGTLHIETIVLLQKLNS